MKLRLIVFLVFVSRYGIIAQPATSSRTSRHEKLRRAPRNRVLLEGVTHDERNVVPRQYLVVLSNSIEDVAASVEQLLYESDCQNILFTFHITMKGFVVTDCSEDDIISILDDPSVLYATEDEKVLGSMSQDVDLLWGLDRIDHKGRGRIPRLDGTYEYAYDGTGVTIYVLDTGIRSTHDEFDGRVTCGFNAYEGIQPCEDNNGHGTFNAAAAAGANYGIAKNSTIINVRVLTDDLSGSITRIISGLEYVANQKLMNPTKPMVVNFSISTQPRSWFFDCIVELFELNFGCRSRKSQAAENLMIAAESLVDIGIPVVASVANAILSTPWDACSTSPAKSSKVISVGASTVNDFVAHFSQYGPCVDIFAPGDGIQSAGSYSDQDQQFSQGTSVSTAFVTGVVALYLERDSTLTPNQIKDRLLADASKGVWLGLFSPNRILSTAALL